MGTAKPSLLLILLIGSTYAAPKAKTALGTILGTERKMETGKNIYSFTGIPYTEPPVGDLRWKAPVPSGPFAGDFNATNDFIMCSQMFFGGFSGQEDCVILNVHTPVDPSALPLAKPLTVMVYIHGGGFQTTSSNSFLLGMPDYLVENDVVLVTLNYRLGLFGFLSTEDEEAPGNYGLLDQLEAVKWVKNHISAFGGNPDDITIFGQSAGSGSVHFLMMSPLAKGLFKQAIIMSGSALNPWATSGIMAENTRKLAEKVGCPTSSKSEMLGCLRTKDAETLVMTDPIEPEKRSGKFPFVWSPRIDSYYIPDHPVNILKSGDFNKVPLLIGHTKDEAADFVGLPKEAYDAEVNEFTNRWDNFCKVSMASREHLISEEDGTDLCNQVKSHYIDEGKSFEESRDDYITMNNDMSYTAGIYKTIELIADQIPVYNYVLNYDNGEVTMLSLFDPTFKYVKGYVPHIDDLLYIFKFPQTQWTPESPAYQMVKMMTKIWTDFAKTGVAAVPGMKKKWPKAKPNNKRYMVLDIPPSIKNGYRPDDISFMNQIYNQTLYNTSIKYEE